MKKIIYPTILSILIVLILFIQLLSGCMDKMSKDESYTEDVDQLVMEDGYEEECISYAEVVNQLAKAGKYNEAIEMAEDTALEPVIQAEAFIKIADSYAEDGKKDNVLEMITRALGAAEKMEKVLDRYEKTLILEEIANIYRKIGQTGDAEDILNEAIELAVTIGEMEDDDYYKIDALTKITSDYANYGQKEKALDIADQALEIAIEMEHKSNKASSLSKIARNYIELGKIDESLSVLAQSYGIAEELEDNYSKVNILTEIAYNYTKAGKEDKALKIINHAFKLIEEIDYNTRILAKMAHVYKEIGLEDKALDVFNQALETGKKEASEFSEGETILIEAEEIYENGW